ncbi:hypothetical protein [Roseibium sp.]|uniref:hypothetical protein n=1 Tax=Roseibium sp. TaxID=1936156 RepID=UPI003BAE1C6B
MLNVKALDQIKPNSELISLTKSRLQAVQRGLAVCAYPVGEADGLHGPKTRNAFAEFVADKKLGDPRLVSGEAVDFLKDKVAEVLKILNAPANSSDQVIERIGEAFRFIGLPHKAQIAYGLATARWETNHTFEPVKEAYWLSESWRRKNLKYYPYYGRGYVQLTWENNYELYESILGLDLKDDPDIALRHDVALFVIAHGMKMGSFTSRKLEQYITKNSTDFINARRVINGTDKASEIAALAEQYLDEI